MRHLLSLGLALAVTLAAHAQSVSIRVVDAATGAAVKGADVRAVVVERVEKRRGERIRIWELDLWEAERETTELRAVSDAEGAATIEIGPVADPESFVLVSARSGDLWAGRATVMEWGEMVKLRLEPDFALDVHVFDAAGQPAVGVPVEYTAEPTEEPRGGSRIYIACATSDASGIARFPHAQDVLSTATEHENLLWARVPTVKRVQIAFDPTQRPLPKLELHLPPCGSVRFTFENEFRGRVLIRHADSRTSDHGFLRSDMDRWRVEVREGVALFPYVEPGVALQYDLDPPKSARSPAVRFLGPKTVGETREMTPGKRMPSRGVLVQLVDTHRVPLRDRKFNLQVRSHFDMGMTGQIGSAFHRKTTDADGRTTFGISSEAACTVELHFKVDGVGEWRGLVPELATGNGIDLGALVLAPIGDTEFLATLDDDALEREFLRVDEFAKLAIGWQKERVPLELLVFEMARRGGERWTALLRSRFDEASRDSTRPGWYLMDELTWLIALRRAQRRPDPIRLELHPEDVARAAFEMPTHIRVALRNVDPEESFELSNDDDEHFVATLTQFGGTASPTPTYVRKSRGGRRKDARVHPGELSSNHEELGWWDIDLSERFELVEGDWTLSLEYVPSFDFESKGEPVGARVAAEPFVLRVR